MLHIPSFRDSADNILLNLGWFMTKFILKSGHENLKFLNDSSKSKKMHAQCIDCIQRFIFSLKHKSRQLNNIANTLSHRVVFFILVSNEIIVFEYLKDLCADDKDFKEEYC